MNIACEDLIIAISEVLEHGDQDNQPWAFYEHDHGGLKGFAWTRQEAETERSNFIEAIINRLNDNDNK
jgi:hypothetical protein